MTKNISKKYSDNHDCCLIEGDVFKEIKNLPDCSVDLIVSSPPYNLNKEYETNKAFDIYLEWLTPLLFLKIMAPYAGKWEIMSQKNQTIRMLKYFL